MYKMRILPIVLFLLLDTMPTNGQNTIGIPQIINFNKNDFRAGTQTWDIDQDSKGRMYFANNEGLLTYDGTFWKVHPLPNKTIMRSIAIDEKGIIYAGGQGEMGYFTPNERGFLKYISLTPLLPSKERAFADIWDIEIIGESVFFRASDRMIMELRNKAISLHPPISGWQFMKKMGNILYAQDQKNGLYVYKNNTWRPATNNQLLSGSVISGMIQTSKESSLILTYDRKSLVLRRDSLSNNSGFELPSSDINFFKVTAMNKGEFVAATTAEGCLIMKNDGKFVQKISRKEGLQNNNVISVFLDKDKNLWAGLNNGISFIAYNSAIKYITPNKENEAAGFSTRIFNNKLFIASSDGCYSAELSPQNKDLSFLRSNFNLVGNSSGQVWRLEEVNQHLLMGHNNGCFDIIGNQAKLISKDAGWTFLPTSPVPPAQNILTGTYSGLKMLTFTNGQFSDKGNLEGLYESLRFLTSDSEGNIWASHPYRGIYRISISSDGKKYSTRLFTEKDGLPSKLDNHVFKIKNRVIFGTNAGAYEFDAPNNRFVPSAFLQPIIANTEVRYMNEDDQGNIWYCSGKKIGMIDFSRGNTKPRPIYFSEITGQILSGFENIYAFDKSNIFIGSEKGVIHLNYEKYKSNKPTLNMMLGTVRAIGKTDSTIFGGYFNHGPLLQKNDNNKTASSLSSNFNAFHFEYSSPGFGIQKNIEYSYRLEGYEKNWSNWSNKTEKDYTNLPAGSYVFHVKAHDNLGNESEEINYSFNIQSPWYKSIWAYLCYLVIIAFGIRKYSAWQKKKLLRQKSIYEKKQRQMSIEHQLAIEQNEKEIIRLRNEKLEAEIMLKTKELADTSMQLVERSDALSKVKDELQKLYKNTNENHDIKKTIHLLNDIEKNSASWEKFAVHFDEINNNFLKNLKSHFPKLTNTDLKVCAYLQLNLASKEIAQLMNITVRGVEISRYRLRKKLGLNTEQSISEFLDQYKEDKN
jgi:ligand-binding sensor domain-containing protein/DNA-binding CsgD family transcriptional regulator